MWRMVISHTIAYVAGSVSTLLIKRRLDRRGEKLPGPQHSVLRVAYEHQQKKGSYLSEEDARTIAGLSDEELELAIAELEQLGEIRVDRSWSGNSLIVTGKGKLSLLRKRRRHGA